MDTTWNRYILVLVTSWLVFFFAAKFRLVHEPVSLTIFGILYMWIPGIIAIWSAKQENIQLPLFRRVNKYWILAPLTALLLGLLAVPVSIPFGEYVGLENVRIFFQQFSIELADSFSPSILYLFVILTVIITGITFNTIAALGEELLWRGYLWEKLKDRGFWQASYLIGLLWGIWHMPLIYFLGYNYPGWPAIGSFIFIILCMLMSPFLSYFRQKGNSILPASFFHGVFNAAPGLCFILFKQFDSLWVGLTSIPFIGLLFLLNVVWLSVRVNYLSRKTQG